MMKEIKNKIYWVVGFASIFLIYHISTNWSKYITNNSILVMSSIILVIIGGLNWLVYAMQKGKKDLLGLIGLK